MKKLLIFALFFTYQSSQAQGNLQFNKVINKQITSTGTNNSSSDGSYYEFGNFTVPDGKIWKVKFGGSVYYANGGRSGNLIQSILCKGPNDTANFMVYNYDHFASGGGLFEYFLSSGTYALFLNNWSITSVKQAQINGIEYNIIAE